MIDIQKLLAKKHCSGAEVGKALFANLIHEVTEGSSLLTQKEFNQLENGIATEKDYSEYNVYSTLFHSIVNSYNKGVYLIDKFDSGIVHYANILFQCMQADRAQQAEDEQPLILTGDQFERYTAEAKEAGITIAEYLRQGGDTPEERFQRFRRSRRAYKGIAIILNYSGKEYKEPESPAKTFDNLDDIVGDQKKLLSLGVSMERKIAPALTYILSFNALVSILGKVHDIENIEALQINTEKAKAQLHDLGEGVKLFYSTVYGNEEEIKRKRAIIVQTFEYWEAEDMEPTAEAIEQVEETLRDYEITEETYKKYKDLDDYIVMLSKRG